MTSIVIALLILVLILAVSIFIRRRTILKNIPAREIIAGGAVGAGTEHKLIECIQEPSDFSVARDPSVLGDSSVESSQFQNELESVEDELSLAADVDNDLIDFLSNTDLEDVSEASTIAIREGSIGNPFKIVCYRRTAWAFGLAESANSKNGCLKSVSQKGKPLVKGNIYWENADLFTVISAFTDNDGSIEINSRLDPDVPIAISEPIPCARGCLCTAVAEEGWHDQLFTGETSRLGSSYKERTRQMAMWIGVPTFVPDRQRLARAF
jgi:hypothetical protein